MADGIGTAIIDPAALNALVDGFPLRLRLLRERSNLTIPQASRLAGLDQGQWRKFERTGTGADLANLPGTKNLLRIQYALSLDTLEPLFVDTSLTALSERLSPRTQAA